MSTHFQTFFRTSDTSEFLPTVHQIYSLFMICSLLSVDCNLTESWFNLSDTNELTIKWKTDPSAGNCTFVYVTIELTLKDCTLNCTATVKRPITNFAYTFPKNLEACGTYEYKLLESQFPGEEARINHNFTTKPQYQKIDLEIEELQDHSSLTISWNYTEHPLCPRNFQLTVYGINDKDIRSSVLGEPRGTVDKLEPCESYLISVEPIQDKQIMTAHGTNTTHKMGPLIPTGIRDLTLLYKQDANSIDVNWESPSSGSKCIESYEVMSENHFESNRTTITKYPTATISNILACVDYSITITTNTFNLMKGAPVGGKIKIPSRGKI